MERVLILGYLPELGSQRLSLPECTIISVAPALTEILAAAGVSHVSVCKYGTLDASWDEIHQTIGSVLREAGGASSTSAAWRDDWSHLLIDESRIDFVWSRVAARIVETERPSTVLVQEPDESHSSCEALRAIAAAFDLIGARVGGWRG